MFRTSMVEDPWNGLSRCAKLVPAHYLNRDNRVLMVTARLKLRYL